MRDAVTRVARSVITRAVPHNDRQGDRLKILHLGHDSHFVDFLVARFERVRPGENELVVVSAAEEAPRPAEFTGPTYRVPPRADRVDEVLERAAAADLVIAHTMTKFAAMVCAQLPPGPRLVWSGFGYDYYVGASAENMFGQLTLDLIADIYDGRQPDATGRLVRETELGTKLEPAALDLIQQFAAARSDYFSAPVDADLPVFTRAFPGFKGQYHQLNYGDLASMFHDPEAVVSGQDILVGNSASWTNNHLEAFRLLGKSDLGSRRVIVPLTYGESGYRNAVLRAGKQRLGKQFVPLVEHLPLDDYLELLGGCGVALFMHRRQQGVGNIVAALQQGSTVYLDRRNPLFGWFRSRGVQVRPAADLRQAALPEGPEAPAVLARHRAIIAELWGSEKVDANIRTLLAEVESGGSGRRLKMSMRRRGRG